MLQKGTNWADGVPGISQCPIPAGSSFQYKFTVDNQYGTYWYHSHMGNTLADGLLVRTACRMRRKVLQLINLPLQGPLDIHSPSEPIIRGRDYDYDQIIMMGDWM